MMKTVTVVTRSIPAHGPGGLERATWLAATGLAERGWSVEIITTALPNGLPTMPKGITIVPVAGSKPARYSAAFYSGVRSHLEKNSSSVPVLAVSAAGFDYLSVPRSRRRPVVLVCHGTSLDEIRSKIRSHTVRSAVGLFRQLLWVPRDLLAYRRADKIISVNDPITQQIRALLPASQREKVKTVYNGFGVEKISATGVSSPGKDFVVCTSGRLVREKGLHILLDALAELEGAERPDEVYICGDGPELDRLKRQARDLPEVHFSGHVDNVLPFLNKASVLVLPSLRLEGLPMSIIEALAVGCPVIVPDSLPFPDVGQAGVLRFKSGNAGELAQLLRQRVLFRRHDGLVKELSLDAMIHGYEGVLQQEPGRACQGTAT